MEVGQRRRTGTIMKASDQGGGRDWQGECVWRWARNRDQLRTEYEKMTEIGPTRESPNELVQVSVVVGREGRVASRRRWMGTALYR
jgi:hypothetical protein